MVAAQLQLLSQAKAVHKYVKKSRKIWINLRQKKIAFIILIVNQAKSLF